MSYASLIGLPDGDDVLFWHEVRSQLEVEAPDAALPETMWQWGASEPQYVFGESWDEEQHLGGAWSVLHRVQGTLLQCDCEACANAERAQRAGCWSDEDIAEHLL